MKTLVTYLLPVIVSLLVSTLANGQSSKSCGSCQKPVSSYSQVGDYCPHCHVRWGYENTTTSTRYVNDYSYDTYQHLSGYGFVTSNANMRAYASKSAYVKRVVPQYSMVTIIGKYGDWYEVEYGGGSWYDKETGYIHKSLIDL
jgi:hypothetical protein